MNYVYELPEKVISIMMAIQEKQMIANGFTMDDIFEANEILRNSKISDIDEADFIEGIFQ